MIIFDGLSEINNQPIMGILTVKSQNRKTGDMGQLWIVPKEVNPVLSVRTGVDESVCGSCPMRRFNGGACYVNVGHGPNSVWKAAKRGSYDNNVGLDDNEKIEGLYVRLGAWGDPTAIPYWVVKDLMDTTNAGHTGYTHRWRDCDQRFKNILMASCDTKKDYEDAKAMGWRTFRVVDDYATIGKNERVCPNDSHGVKCSDCLACHGGSGVDIAIKVHGSLAGKRWEAVKEKLALV